MLSGTLDHISIFREGKGGGRERNHKQLNNFPIAGSLRNLYINYMSLGGRVEKEMATHSSILAWRIPGTEEPGGLPSMGSHRVGHD